MFKDNQFGSLMQDHTMVVGDKFLCYYDLNMVYDRNPNSWFGKTCTLTEVKDMFFETELSFSLDNNGCKTYASARTLDGVIDGHEDLFLLIPLELITQNEEDAFFIALSDDWKKVAKEIRKRYKLYKLHC